MSTLDDLPGANELKDWFGYLPNFHDSEVLKLDLRRSPEPSSLLISVWHTSDKVETDGTFHRERHAEVRFVFTDIILLEISGWNHQNVLARLDFSASADGIAINLMSSFGIEGRIVARDIRVMVETAQERSVK